MFEPLKESEGKNSAERCTTDACLDPFTAQTTDVLSLLPIGQTRYKNFSCESSAPDTSPINSCLGLGRRHMIGAHNSRFHRLREIERHKADNFVTNVMKRKSCETKRFRETNLRQMAIKVNIQKKTCKSSKRLQMHRSRNGTSELRMPLYSAKRRRVDTHVPDSDNIWACRPFRRTIFNSASSVDDGWLGGHLQSLCSCGNCAQLAPDIALCLLKTIVNL